AIDLHPLLPPPRCNCVGRELRCIPRSANIDVTGVPLHVVNSVWNGTIVCLAQKVVLIHRFRTLTPRPAILPKVPYGLLLFRVDADDRVAGGKKGLPLRRDIPELLVAVWRVPSHPRLDVNAKCIAKFSQETPDYVVANLIALLAE